MKDPKPFGVNELREMFLHFFEKMCIRDSSSRETANVSYCYSNPQQREMQ